MSLSEPASSQSPDAVAAFLRANPDWLARHPELIPAGEAANRGAVPLADHQLADLRRRNAELTDRLRELTRNARRNEQLFQACRQLAVRLFDVHDADDAVATLHATLTANFGFEAVTLLSDVLPASMHVRDPSPVAHLLGRSGVFLGNIRADEANALFGDGSGATSVAIAPLRATRPLGHLAFGSSNAAHFGNGQGTVFVDFVADLAGRTLSRYLPIS